MGMTVRFLLYLSPKYSGSHRQSLMRGPHCSKIILIVQGRPIRWVPETRFCLIFSHRQDWLGGGSWSLQRMQQTAWRGCTNPASEGDRFRPGGTTGPRCMEQGCTLLQFCECWSCLFRGCPEPSKDSPRGLLLHRSSPPVGGGYPPSLWTGERSGIQVLCRLEDLAGPISG